MRRVTTVLFTLVAILLAGCGPEAASQQEKSKHTTKQNADLRSREDLAALIREAAAVRRLAEGLTTPDEFKAIVGQPTREWTELDGEYIVMEYPGTKVRFYGKPQIHVLHTLVEVLCEGGRIDCGFDGPVVLRNEGDLEKFGLFWGYSGVDLSRLDLSQKGKLLEAMTFDSLTVWPKADLLPPGFDPKRRLEWGKNPGLGIRSLHQKGITGKGVGIAIIDQPLLRDHVEYADRIRSYHAIDVEGADPGMHGPPVCSIAVGKTCGVAPQASLHYCAVPTWTWTGNNRAYARAVEQTVEQNRHLSPSEKVRVISISIGVSQWDHYDQWRAAVDKAKQQGVLVVACDEQDFIPYRCIGRKVGTDPDDPNNYGSTRLFGDGNAPVYVPIANRTRAGHRGKDVYTFDTRGGSSWAAPYLAGLAALAFQVHPGISPDEIVKLWQETASRTQLGPVVNPRGFIEAVKHLKRSG